MSKPSSTTSALQDAARRRPLPYGRQCVDEDDIRAVAEVLRSDWLTTGPKVEEFEHAFAGAVGAAQAVAVANGTAALHAAISALEIGPGDEVIVPAMTFAATANCIVYQGGTPIFADVDPETLLIDPTSIEARISSRTRAVIAVDYAGQPCDYDSLRQVAKDHGLKLVADACHALGARYRGRAVGSLSDLSTFSFHPVKPLTSAEGGMITTDDPGLASHMRRFRNHGITSDHRQREAAGSWFYEMTDLGYNYRLSDMQCALGLSQLSKLEAWTRRRREIARSYDLALAEIPAFETLTVRPEVEHAYHLYVVRVDTCFDRAGVFGKLRDDGIGVNVHYIPVHLHPFYRQRFGTGSGLCPVAEEAYEKILSLPIFPAMSDGDIDDVVTALGKATATSSSGSSLPADPLL